MNETENQTSDASELAELKKHYASLSRQVGTLLLGLFVVSATFTVFLGIQARRMGKDLESIRPQATQMIERATKEEPVITKFMSELSDYGRTHPDFKPIMTKFRISTNAAAYKNPGGGLPGGDGGMAPAAQ